MSKTELPVITTDDLRQYARELNLTPKQLSLLLGPTPRNHVRKRKAKGGGHWDYVNVYYVTKVLNLVYGFDWSFEVRESNFDLDIGQGWVLGRLTVPGINGDRFKEQYGRIDLKFYKDRTLPDGRRMPLDIGNDLKGAASDALKKCASLIGIAGDIYAADEFKPVRVVSKETKDAKTVLRFFQHLNTCTSQDEADLLLEDFESQGYSLDKDQKQEFLEFRSNLNPSTL